MEFMGNTGRDRVEAAFDHVQRGPLAKGELWLGSDILHSAGFEDNLDGRIKLVKRLNQDLICLPIADEPYVNKELGYRYFPVDAIQDALETTDLFVMLVIDGPFQRLAEKMGLMAVFSGWIREKESILRAYEDERADVKRLLGRCLKHPVHGVVIADDLAGDQSTFLDPIDIQRFFSPFYDQAVSEIHAAHAHVLFHSCGNISKIVPQLVSHGFDGLASIQGQTNDLISLKARYGSKLVLMTGIEGEMLEKKKLSPSDLGNLAKRLKPLVQNGGFILSSACGLYSGQFLERIEAIYNFI